MVYNPHITRQGKKWVLYYIGSTHPFTEVKHSENITMQDPRVIVAGFGGGCARSENGISGISGGFSICKSKRIPAEGRFSVWQRKIKKGNDRMESEKENLIRTEEEINAAWCLSQRKAGEDGRIHRYKEEIDKELEKLESLFCGELTFYQEVCSDIRKMTSPSFLKPAGKIRAGESRAQDGDIDAPKFYLYAYIDKNTWNHIKNNRKGISRESALKLVIALQVTEERAEFLLGKLSFALNPGDYRDRIIIAILNARCYNPDQASEVLEWYGRNGKYKFTNIY